MDHAHQSCSLHPSATHVIVVDQLLADASASTGLDDFGDVPFLEALGVLADSFNDRAHVDEGVAGRAAQMLTGILVKRLRLVDDRRTCPEIADEVVAAPIVIVGQPRSGSTHLHALMACVGGLRSPRQWEMSSPSPPPERATYETDPRIAAAQAALDAMPAEFLVRHPVAAARPEQCNGLMDWSLVNQGWMATYDIPAYRDWFLDADYAPAYEAHRRTLQQLQWHAPGRWVLKYPKHLLSLDALLETYPDATLIWTHRDPAAVIPSVLSLTGFMREPNMANYDPVRFAREWTSIEELTLHRGLATRDHDTVPTRNIDVDYRSLMADPIGTVETLCDRTGVPFDDGSRGAVQQWLDEHAQDRHGVHRYTPEDFGLNADRIRNRFAFYSRRFETE